MAKKKSQSSQIISYLKQGRKITAIEALNIFSCFRLAARINELKAAGHNIKTEAYTYKTAIGEMKTIARYYL